MNYKDVERNLERRIANAKTMASTTVTKDHLVFGLEATMKELKAAMYAPENPESDANTLGKCSKCGQYLPRA